MIWTPDRPGPRDTERWLQQLHEDNSWPHNEQPGSGPGGQEPAGAPGPDGQGDAGAAGPDPRWVADGDMRWAAEGEPPRGVADRGWAGEGETRRWVADGDTGWAAGAAPPRGADVHGGRRLPEPPRAPAQGGRHGGDPLLRPSPPTGRAVIGDQLRIPVVWCQLGSCIERYTDPAVLGEADVRARAIAAGWREDALGRFTCPACQQTSEDFWATQQVVQWDREMAVAMTSLIAAAIPEDAVGAAGAETGVLPAALPVPPPDGGAGARETVWSGPPDSGRHRHRHRRRR